MIVLAALMGALLFSGGKTPEPQVPVLQTYAVTLTGYNAVPAQTDSDPFTTASGAYSNPEVIAARSVDLKDELPFGTIIELVGPSADPKNTCGYEVVDEAIGYRVIADSMNPRYTDRIDVLFDTKANYIMPDNTTKNAGTILGICDGVTIKVLGRINITQIPKTQAELAKLVKDGKTLAVNK